MRCLRAVIAILLFVLATIFRKGSTRTERYGVTQQRKRGGERRDVGGPDWNPTAQRFRSTPIRLPNGGVKHYSVLRSNAPPPKTTHPSKPPAFYHPYIFPSIQV